MAKNTKCYMIWVNVLGSNDGWLAQNEISKHCEIKASSHSSEGCTFEADEIENIMAMLKANSHVRGAMTYPVNSFTGKPSIAVKHITEDEDDEEGYTYDNIGEECWVVYVEGDSIGLIYPSTSSHTGSVSMTWDFAWGGGCSQNEASVDSKYAPNTSPQDMARDSCTDMAQQMLEKASYLQKVASTLIGTSSDGFSFENALSFWKRR